MRRSRVYYGENYEVLKKLKDKSVDLIYIDPPFNTGKAQKRGFIVYDDDYFDYFGYMNTRLHEAKRVLSDTGSMYIHIDYREVHTIRFLMDTLFGAENLLNEIIWAYDYGGRPKTRWPAKHDNILFYVKNKKDYTFNVDDIVREPYMAPGLVGPEKAAKGKLPTDVWWHTIVHTNGKEKTGYPTQKPEGVLSRIITASSNKGDTVLDFFAGSGTTGKVCNDLGRRFIMVDNNKQAIKVMKRRFRGMKVKYYA